MEIYHLCSRKSEINRDIQRERERESEQAWPAMRSKEWGQLGWTDLDRQSTFESIQCVDRGRNREIYHLCVKESKVNRDSEKRARLSECGQPCGRKSEIVSRE
jgi:hypothetical protein